MDQPDWWPGPPIKPLPPPADFWAACWLANATYARRQRRRSLLRMEDADVTH